MMGELEQTGSTDEVGGQGLLLLMVGMIVLLGMAGILAISGL
jgi:hypothetical protein